MITVIFYRTINNEQVVVRTESCYNEIELDELLEHESFHYDSYEVLDKA
jgi:hypothetical protein